MRHRRRGPAVPRVLPRPGVACDASDRSSPRLTPLATPPVHVSCVPVTRRKAGGPAPASAGQPPPSRRSARRTRRRSVRPQGRAGPPSTPAVGRPVIAFSIGGAGRESRDRPVTPYAKRGVGLPSPGRRSPIAAAPESRPQPQCSRPAIARSAMSVMIRPRSKSFGVNTAASARPRAAASRSSSGMIPPTTTGTRLPRPSLSTVVRHQFEVASRTGSRADDIDILVAGGRGDLLRGQADALVDDLHAGVACGDGDLLGAVGVTIEPGLGHEEPRRPVRQGLDPLRTSAENA